MRKLSLAAMISATLYLVCGILILLCQNLLKPLFSTSMEYIMVYPPNILARLLFVGLPCVILSAIHISGSHSTSRALPFGIAFYSGITLAFQDFIDRIFNAVSSAFTGRLGGVNHLVNQSMVNNMFGIVELFSHVALVLLLIATVTEICRQK